MATTSSPRSREGLVVRAARADTVHEVDRIRHQLRRLKKHAARDLCVQFYALPIDAPVSGEFMAALGEYTFDECDFGGLSLYNLPVTTAWLDARQWELGRVNYALVGEQILWEDDEHASYLAAVRRYVLYGHTGVLPSPGNAAVVGQRVAAYKGARPRPGAIDVESLLAVVRGRTHRAHV